MNTVIIGVTGRIGSGKDEVLKHLKARYNVPFLSTGEIVRELAAKEGLPPTRENLETISGRYFKELGQGCFVKKAVEEIKKRGWKVAGISGVRALADAVALREISGNSFFLLSVEVTDPHLRFQRLMQRHEGRDPETLEHFLDQDRAEEEIFQISKTMAMSDYVLKNDGSLKDLHRQIDGLVSEGKLPL